MTIETMANLASEAAGLTPVMRQYFAAKEQHPDCLMFCRIGDFYELFYDDAILVSRELQLTLTARDREKKQPMCGVPYHAAEIYLQRLLKMGYRVALCEQMDKAKVNAMAAVQVSQPFFDECGIFYGDKFEAIYLDMGLSQIVIDDTILPTLGGNNAVSDEIDKFSHTVG